MSKHTPGPWIAETNEKAGSITILGPRVDGDVRQSDGLGSLVEVDCARLDGDRFPPMNPEDIANARLIAAAPELLLALQMLHDDLAEYQRINNIGGYDNHAMRMARAAIAKATGDAA